MTKPTYRVIAISLYDEDLELLDAKLAELKRRRFRATGVRGGHGLSRSKLLRLLIAQLDVEALASAASAEAPATTPAPADVLRLPPLSSGAIARALPRLPAMTATAMTRALRSPASASLRA